MTFEERLDRIENLTADLAEERRKDRDEHKALWRETQRQLDDSARSIASLTRDLVTLTGSISELGIRIRDLAEESRAADQRLEERIASLVSAMAEHVHQGHP